MAGAVALAAVLAGCSEEPDPVSAPQGSLIDPAAAASVIADLAVELGEPGPAEVARWPDYFETNVEAIGVSDVGIRFLVDDAELSATLAPGQWAGVVDLSWRFADADRAPAQGEVSMIFSGRGDDLRIVGVGGGGRVAPLWLQTPVEVARGKHALAVVAGADAKTRAATYVHQADLGLRAVREVLRPATQGVVIEAPADVAQLERTLGTDPGSYRGIAAVTTPVDGSTAPGAPTHIFLNPAQFGSLAPRGAQVVITHEVTHVATGAATAVAVPLWLTEGFADYVALRGSDVPVTRAAAQIIAQVRKNGAPTTLPSDAEFAARTAKLGASYEAAWMVCTVLADRGGESALLQFHQRVMAGASVGPTLRKVFGISEAELVALWGERLLELAG
ncbi:hypothetical protein ACLM5J_14985 [Nocardioides sp. Bht2]|uniref:hypothetical protein n=1 Tax=Nocardioides sp. Bht2 TaxID=3392297 RepID=UPI0039B50B2F